MCGVLAFGLNAGYVLIGIVVLIGIFAVFTDSIPVLIIAALVLGIPGLLLVPTANYYLGKNECSQYQPNMDPSRNQVPSQPVPTSNLSVSPSRQGVPGDATDPFAGTWQGTVTQTGLSPYPVVFVLNQHDTDIAGNATYPGQTCSGALTLTAYTSANIILREDEMAPSAQCTGVEWNLYLGDNHATMSGRGRVDDSGGLIGIQLERSG